MFRAILISKLLFAANYNEYTCPIEVVIISTCGIKAVCISQRSLSYINKLMSVHEPTDKHIIRLVDPENQDRLVDPENQANVCQFTL